MAANVRWSKVSRENVNKDLTGTALFDLSGGGGWSILFFESGISGRVPLDSELVTQVQAWEDYNSTINYNMNLPDAYDLSYNIGRYIVNKLTPPTVPHTNPKYIFPTFGKLLLASYSPIHCATGENLIHDVNEPSPTANVTMDFSRITQLVPGLNNGTAHYFIIKEINPLKTECQNPTLRPMLFGTIGIFGSGADMEMGNVNIVENKLYKLPPISLKLPLGPLQIESV